MHLNNQGIKCDLKIIWKGDNKRKVFFHPKTIFISKYIEPKIHFNELMAPYIMLTAISYGAKQLCVYILRGASRNWVFKTRALMEVFQSIIRGFHPTSIMLGWGPLPFLGCLSSLNMLCPKFHVMATICNQYMSKPLMFLLDFFQIEAMY